MISFDTYRLVLIAIDLAFRYVVEY